MRDGIVLVNFAMNVADGEKALLRWLTEGRGYRERSGRGKNQKSWRDPGAQNGHLRILFAPNITGQYRYRFDTVPGEFSFARVKHVVTVTLPLQPLSSAGLRC